MLRAFPYAKRRHGLARLIERHRIERLESPVQELLALRGPRRVGACSEHDRHEAAIAALRRCDKTPAGRLGMTGLDAVDVRIRPQQPVAIRLRDVVVAVFLLRIDRIKVRIVADQRRRETRDVGGRRVMLRIREPGRIGEVRRCQLEARRFLIHPLDECVLGAGDRLGERDRRIVARLDDHTVEQLLDAHRLARLDEHPRAFGAPRLLRHGHHLRGNDRLRAQRTEHEIRRHELGERRGIAFFGCISGGERLARQRVEQEVGLRSDAGRRNGRARGRRRIRRR